MTEHLARYVKEKAALLEEVGIDQGRAEIELILCHLLNCDRLKLYIEGMQALSDQVRQRADEIIARRLTRYPLQFILGEAWFYGRRFIVTPEVMAPTPETEMLCEHALRYLGSRELTTPRVLDIGVGSGVISVTLAAELADCRITALDISPGTLNIAQQNALAYGVWQKMEFRESDLFAKLGHDEQFDLILSNPPYIAEGDYAGLEPEVLADPKISLVGGREGMDIIKRIIADAPRWLAENGRIMFEIGCGQAELVAEEVEKDGRYREFSILRDLNDRDRIAILALESHHAA